MLMRTIKIKDYISNDEDLMNEILTFDENLLLLKETTGMGLTNALLTQTKKNVIVLSPMTGMISSKENKRLPHNLFIYGGSRNKHIDIFTPNGRTSAVNMTCEQLIIIYENDKPLWEYISDNFHIVMDEYHMITDAAYREDNMSKLYNILYNEVKLPFLLTSATYREDKLDIPYNIKTIRVELEEPRLRKVDIRPLHQYNNFITNEVSNGNKVVVFTNDVSKINTIHNSNFTEDRSKTMLQLLAADKLTIKTKQYIYISEDEQLMQDRGIIDDSKNILILSTKYATGFDVNHDASIAIICDPNSISECRNIFEIVQSIGRVRTEVKNICIFYKPLKHPVLKPSLCSNPTFSELLDFIKLDDIYNVQDHAILIKNLRKYKFIVTSTFKRLEDISKSARGTIEEKINNIKKQSLERCIKDIEIIFLNIQGDGEDGFSRNMALLWVYVIIDKFSGVMSTSRYRNLDLVNRLKAFLDVNYPDINSKSDFNFKHFMTKKQLSKYDYLKIDNPDYFRLYGLVRSEELFNSKHTDGTNNSGKLFNDISLFINTFYYELNYTKLINQSLIARLELKEEVYKRISDTRELYIDFKECVNRAYTGDDEFLIDKLRKLKNIKDDEHRDRELRMTYKKDLERLFIMNWFIFSVFVSNNPVGFKIRNVDNRSYNPLTKTIGILRTESVIELAEADIKSAFSTFVDNIVGSNIGKNVYTNLMNSTGVSRSKAKEIYNIWLNTYDQGFKEFFEKGQSFGYTYDQLCILGQKCLRSKGSFFREMTPLEERYISHFKTYNNIKYAIRLHDGIYFVKNQHFLNKLKYEGGVEFELR